MFRIFAKRTDSQQSSRRRSVYSVAALVLFAFATLAFTSAAHAQFRTSIQGVVTDPDGAVVPGAKLTLKDTATNATVVRTSDSAGVFNFNALPADVFTLNVSHAGFQSKVLDHLQLIPEQPNSITVKLDLGGVDTTVTVDASTSPAVDTQTSNIGATITSNDVQHYPSYNRDVFTLTQLAPGTIADGSRGAGGGSYNFNGNQGPGGTPGNGQMAIENGPQSNANGGQYETNSLSIDGISTTSAVWGGTSVITPTEDSVDNVRVVTNDYDAENGRFSGAQTIVTSKSGTNQLHGSAFLSIHRPGLNAYQHRLVTPTVTTSPTRDTNRFNQYGASLGGPIIKNRLFAFFAYESSPNNSTATDTGWYETAAFDKLARSGSVANTFLTYPGAGAVVASLVSTTCAGAGLVQGVNCQFISGQGLDLGSPLTTPLGTMDPHEGGTNSTPGIGNGFDGVADIAQYTTLDPSTSYYRQFNGRMDADATKKDHLAFTIYWVPEGNTHYVGGDRQYNLFHHQSINDAFAVIWDHTFSPTFLNEARANAGGWRYNEIASNPQQPVGLPTDNIDQIGSITLNPFGSSLGGTYNQWTYTYKDVATKILRAHTIKFGAEVTRLYYLNNPTYTFRPTYNFYGIWDFLNDSPMQETGNFNPQTGFPGGSRQDERENFFAGFVQDDWKARPNLTLHAGLRYTYFGSLYSKENNIGVVNLGSGATTLTGITIHAQKSLWTPQKFNFGPQVGFNWSPEMFHSNVTIRGGYGLTFNQEEIAISANGGGNPPGTFNANFQYSAPGNPGTNGADILYGVSSSPTNLFGYASNPHTIANLNNAAGIPTVGNNSVVAYPGKMPTQYASHYSLDTEYQFLHNALVASLGYQGSTSMHTIEQYQVNAVAISAGYTLNPLLTGVQCFCNEGSGNNNALLAELKHPFSHHYSVDAQFMWAKSFDQTSGPYSGAAYPNTPSANYGRSDYNVDKSFKVFGLWQPVFFHGNNLLEKIAGGWSLSGIFNVHTGFPWTPNYGTPQSLYCSNCGYSTLYPSYLGGGARSGNNKAYENGTLFPNYVAVVAAQVQPTATVNGTPNTAVAYHNQYFNIPNFQAAMTGTFPGVNAALPPAPGLRRNSFTGPGYRDVDASLSKAFGIPDTRLLGNAAKFEIRADAFNLFNISNLNPQSISTNITSSNFGQDTNLLGARMVSFQARFSF